jgi:hypothetical protein
VKDGGSSPVFTENCPMLAGQVRYAANFSGCPEIGTAGASNPCGGKIDAAQASSISAVLALGTPSPIASATGNTPGGGGSNTLTAGGSSPTASSSSKSSNIAEREQPRSWLLGGVALLAGLGALLL